MKNTKTNIDYFDLNIGTNEIRVLITIVIVLVIILLFRKKFNHTIEKIIVFSILFLLFLVITKNLIVTIIGTSIVFLLVNLIMTYRNTLEKTVEKFEDLKNSDSGAELAKLLDGLKGSGSKLDLTKILGELTNSGTEPSLDINNIFNTDDMKKSKNNIQDLLKQVNGGIELNDSDTKETEVLGIETHKYSDDKKPNPSKDAQKETYELINTVGALKDTITSLAPVLQEGKKLMDLFQSLKI